MAGKKDFVFHPNSLVRLLCHYTDGAVPMRGEVKDMLVNPYLGRVIGLLVESNEWKDNDIHPLQVRYDGKRIATWVQGGEEGHMTFEQRAETPARQN
jgi:hypothetical protein